MVEHHVDLRKIDDLRAVADRYDDLDYLVSELRDVSTIANLAQEHYLNTLDERSQSALIHALDRMMIVSDRLFDAYHREAA